MKLDLIYRQPRLLILTIALIIVGGLSVLSTIGRQEDPTITNLYALISTPYPGAEASRVEELLTIPIEEKLRRIPEIDLIESTSSAGVSVISVELMASVDVNQIERIWAEVRDELEDARPSYPEGAGPSNVDTDFANTYAAIIAISADRPGIPPAILGRYANALSLQLQNVSGTSKIQTFGMPKEEIRVEILPAKLASLGLTFADVASAIAQADGRTQAGRLANEGLNMQLNATEGISTLQDLYGVDLRNDNDTAVHLGTLADISRSVRDPAQTIGVHNGEDAVLVAVRIEDGVRIDRWTTAIRAELADFKAAAPDGLRIEMIFDQGGYTNKRLIEVASSLAIGLGLVVAILLVSMGLRAALIVGATIPLVGLATIASLYYVGVPIHQMSITGLIVALGLVVDANIVMVDEIMRRIAAGQSRATAVSGSIRRLIAPLTASTLTTAFAFMPMLLLPGASGDFISTIAVAVLLMLGWSLVIALVLTSGLAGWILPEPPEDAAPSALLDTFTALLRWSLAHPRLSLSLFLSPALLGMVLAPTLPAQFFPGVDRDQFQVEIHMAPGVPLEQTHAAALAVGDALRADPLVESVTWMVGRGMPMFYYNVLSQEGSTPNYAHAMVVTQSPAATLDVLRRVQGTLGADIPAAQVVVRRLVQGPPVTAPVETRLFGQDVVALREAGEEIRRIMVDTPGIVGTRASLSGGAPGVTLQIDEARAEALGFENASIAAQIADAIDGRVGGSIQEGEEQIPIRVMAPRQTRESISAIGDLYLVQPHARSEAADAFTATPLSTLASIHLTQKESSLYRRNGARVNIVQAFTAADVLPQSVETDLLARLDASGFNLPSGVTMKTGGDSDARDQTLNDLQASLGMILVLAVATVILTFGSFRLAAISGVVCVLSVGSSLLCLALTGQPLGIMAIIGIIGAIGVSINAAIIVITALQENLHARGQDEKAIVLVVSKSVRHISSTTITTFAGFLPLIFAGGGFWPPFAIAIAGGVLLSTIISLVITPILFAKFWASRDRLFDQRLDNMAPSPTRSVSTDSSV
ncbi:efflux RND transporter permease subunit [Sulfitobacter sp. F26169L]|uniref:efflux RND transporter permease subunit n=1 Tax=Sulfitobacter sp. F26169L TaxID=2996015 RepID=UPI002260982D|nr:efflux RND transporter permease subunit [Sulfitobacter sp. F26169L]MCX7567523.1 efflux RND transporter permease subunit [Sulfitobacter sp. F26169L]